MLLASGTGSAGISPGGQRGGSRLRSADSPGAARQESDRLWIGPDPEPIGFLPGRPGRIRGPEPGSAPLPAGADPSRAGATGEEHLGPRRWPEMPIRTAVPELWRASLGCGMVARGGGVGVMVLDCAAGAKAQAAQARNQRGGASPTADVGLRSR